MSNAELRAELQSLAAILDADSFPELHEYLADILSGEEGEDAQSDPFEIANDILRCDRPASFPKEVIDTVTLLFESAFAAGNADAMNDLGAQYYDGRRGFEQNFAKAFECYRLAAQNGSRQAQENLGYCYYYGRHVPVDYEKAFHYFALGAFDGHLISLYKIGDMYAAGYYVQKNTAEAFRIYSRCMETMTEEASGHVAGPVYLRLGKCLLNGVGVERNARSALWCYQKAEQFLFDMVRRGDIMYRKSLSAAIDGQTKAREILKKELPDNKWIDE
jgi:TPR repeat protein